LLTYGTTSRCNEYKMDNTASVAFVIYRTIKNYCVQLSEINKDNNYCNIITCHYTTIEFTIG